jgi:hypothetical protein
MHETRHREKKEKDVETGMMELAKGGMERGR